VLKFNSSKKVLVIGRAGMDIYPEPPGTKISEVKNFSSHLGGSAANTCVALSLHGIESDLVTCVSNDAIGEFIFNKLDYYNVGTKHCLKINKSFQTQLAVVETILENNQSILYRNNACDLKLENQMIDKINFQEYDSVVVSDYNKGYLSEQILFEISKRHPITFLDTKKLLKNWCEEYSFIKINNKEYEASREVMTPTVLSKTIRTKGPHGCVYQNVLYPVNSVEVKDTSGAGDTFISALAVRYTEVKDICEAIKFANKCATLVVQKRGVSVI